MTFNSSFVALKDQDVQSIVYSSERSNQGYAWIQPSIISKSIGTENAIIIDGVYVKPQPTKVDMTFGFDFNGELEAWEAASDEALRNFEALLD